MAKPTPSCCANSRARAVRVDEGHVRARKVPAKERDHRTDRAGPYNRDPVRRSGRRIPYGVERRFHVRRQNGTLRCDRLGQR